MKNENRAGPLNMTLAALCWSFGGLCIKFIPWSALSIIGLRALLAAALFAFYRRSVKISFTRGNILAALCLAGTTILFVFANKLTTAAAAILLQFSAPVFVLLLELFTVGKKPKPSEIIAVTATLAGMLLFFADRLAPGNLLGNLLAIASGLSFAGVFVFNKRPDVVPEQSLFLGFLLNAAVGLPFVFLPGGFSFDLLPIGAILFLGLVQVGLAYVFFTRAIRRTPALLACLIAAVEPILNPLWVALFLGELPGVYALSGGVLILATVIGYQLWREKHDIMGR